MTNPEPTKYSIPDGTAYTITDTANLTKRQQVALVVLPAMLGVWSEEKSVRESYRIAGVFLKEQS